MIYKASIWETLKRKKKPKDISYATGTSTSCRRPLDY